MGVRVSRELVEGWRWGGGVGAGYRRGRRPTTSLAVAGGRWLSGRAGGSLRERNLRDVVEMGSGRVRGQWGTTDSGRPATANAVVVLAGVVLVGGGGGCGR